MLNVQTKNKKQPTVIWCFIIHFFLNNNSQEKVIEEAKINWGWANDFKEMF